MTGWRLLSGERRQLFGAIGVRPVDNLTGGQPLGTVRAVLERLEATGWVPVPARVLVSSTGIITCPGLERAARPAAAPRHYRIRLEADLYRPLYRATVDGIEFDAYQYNDTTDPAGYARSATDAPLAPLPGYPFPAYVPVLYGSVTDAAGLPVADVLVSDPPGEQALTDDAGQFALPLRLAAPGAPVDITANDRRTGRTGIVAVTVPADLSRSHTIQIT
jgi:hypothetical protein